MYSEGYSAVLEQVLCMCCQVVLAAIRAEGGASRWQGLCLTDLKCCNIAVGQVEHPLSHRPSQVLK